MKRGIAIFGSKRQGQSVNAFTMAYMLRRLVECGFNLFIHKDFCDSVLTSIGVDVPYNEVEIFPAGEVEAVISFGGDGTMLRTAQWVGQAGTPILGINTGHLGYLTGYTMSDTDAEQAVRLLYGRTGVVDHRMVLKVEVDGMPQGFWPYAINEVALLRNVSAQLITVHTSVNGRYVADYQGDGLIVATPTGSTAYNMSCGGPILEPALRSIILTPIAPHSLNMRPLVMGGEAVVEAEVCSRTESFRISLDGRTFDMPCADDEWTGINQLRISRAEFTVNTIHDPRTDFASVLRSKLLWGAR